MCVPSRSLRFDEIVSGAPSRFGMRCSERRPCCSREIRPSPLNSHPAHWSSSISTFIYVDRLKPDVGTLRSASFRNMSRAIGNGFVASPLVSCHLAVRRVRDLSYVFQNFHVRSPRGGGCHFLPFTGVGNSNRMPTDSSRS